MPNVINLLSERGTWVRSQKGRDHGSTKIHRGPLLWDCMKAAPQGDGSHQAWGEFLAIYRILVK